MENCKKTTTTTARKRKHMDPMHTARIQLMYQELNIRGKELLRRWPQYPRSVVYEWVVKPVTDTVPVDRRKFNKGRPRLLTQQDERQILRCIPKLRSSVGHFTSKRIQVESGTTHVCNRTVRNYLNKNKYHYLRSRKNGLLTKLDLKNCLKYCRKAKKINFDTEFWTKQVSFYLDGKGFIYKTNPFDMATAPRAREWRKPNEGLNYGCVAKGSKEGVRNANFMVAICYSKGVVICEQYFGRIDGKKFADIVKRTFSSAFEKSINPRTRRLLMDGCPNQNSKVAKDAIAEAGGIIFKIPARSADLNPIENTFNQVENLLQQQAIDRNITKESFEEFSQRVKDTVMNFDVAKINKVIESMPKRIQEVINARGQRIDY